jgi:hypothetical protein
MGTTIFPAVSSSPLKSVQRGVATTAGNITITAVNPNRTIINSFSTSSAGTVAATGSMSVSLTPSGGEVSRYISGTNTGNQLNVGSYPSYSGSGTLSGGTTNLTTAQYGAYLVDATTIAVTGPCRYEVIEFN